MKINAYLKVFIVTFILSLSVSGLSYAAEDGCFYDDKGVLHCP